MLIVCKGSRFSQRHPTSAVLSVLIITRYCVPAQILMRFMAKAWHLDLDEVVCEFAQDHDHKFWFVRVVSFEWRDGQFAS